MLCLGLLFAASCGSDSESNCLRGQVEGRGACYDLCSTNRDCILAGLGSGFGCYDGVCDLKYNHQTTTTTTTQPTTTPTTSHPATPTTPVFVDTTPDPTEALDTTFMVRTCYWTSELNAVGAKFGQIAWSTGNSGIEDWSHTTGWNRTIVHTGNYGCFTVRAVDVCKGFWIDVSSRWMSYPADVNSSAWLKNAIRPAFVEVNSVRQPSSNDDHGWFTGPFSNSPECIH
jgi:hypothetical protein